MKSYCERRLNDDIFIPNSSFLLLFIKDIRRVDILEKIFKKYHFIVTYQVITEVITKVESWGIGIKWSFPSEIYDADLEKVREGNPVIVHEPMLGLGEFSTLLVFWYLYHKRGMKNLYIIMDDLDARKYVRRNLQEDIPYDRIIWSLKFLDMYVLQAGLIDKHEFLIILDIIEKSGFRVTKDILSYYRKKYSRNEI